MFSTIQAIVFRSWTSPTLTSWASIIARTVSIAIVLPLVLTKMDAATIVLWELFLTIIGFQFIASSGFLPSFFRALGYARAGHRFDLKLASDKDDTPVDPPESFATDPSEKQELIGKAIRTMSIVSQRMTFGLFAILMLLGTAAVYRSVVRVEDPREAWIAWAVVCITVALKFRGMEYIAFLHGTENIPLQRRWESLFSLIAAIASVATLLLGGGIAALTIAYQVPGAVNVIVDAWNSKKVARGLGILPGENQIDPGIFDFVWPAFWRSAVGIWAQTGSFRVATILATQSDRVEDVAPFLLALRLVYGAMSIGQVPFLCRIPQLVTLFAENSRTRLLNIAQRSMFYSHTIYVIIVCGLAILGPTLFEWLGSSVSFPNRTMWMLIAAGFFVQRFGGMHIQLFSLTNRIIWHVANGITGLLFISLLYPLYLRNGLVAFPIALLVANLAFYAWYSAIHSYREFGLNFVQFETRASLPAAIALLVTCISLSFV